MSAGETQVNLDLSSAKQVPLNWAVIGIVKDFGIVVVLIWYLWFTQTVTLPTTQKDFHDLIDRERANYSKELQAQRTHDEKRNLDVAKAITELAAEIRRRGPG